MPVTEFWVAIAMILLVVAQMVLGLRERTKAAEDARRERAEMLNRIISKDAREFAMLTRVAAPVDDRSVYSVKEADDVEKNDGLGMPVA